VRTIKQRTRRGIVRICIAVSFAMLAAVIVFPAFARRLPGGGWLTVVSAAVGITAGVAYLSGSGGAR
jgi:hypothetical protein